METKKVKEKYYYDVKVETVVPAVITYRILAETPEEAAEMIKHHNVLNVKYNFNHRKNKKILVYRAGTILLQFVKNILGH